MLYGAERGEADKALPACGRFAFLQGPSSGGTKGYREYVSDPANPVPIERGRFRRPIREATGGPGRLRTSGSSTIGQMFCRSSVKRLIVI